MRHLNGRSYLAIVLEWIDAVLQYTTRDEAFYSINVHARQ